MKEDTGLVFGVNDGKFGKIDWIFGRFGDPIWA